MNKAITLVTITIAALAAVGITTSVMSHAISVYAQKAQPGDTVISGHISAPDRGSQVSGGGHAIIGPHGEKIKCVGSSGFKAALGC